MPRLSSWYCGMVWYLANSVCHSACESGGKTPVSGFHSTIESPDSVSRVAPPTINVSNIIAADTSNHSRTGRKRTLDALIGSCILVLLAGDGADHIVGGDALQLRVRYVDAHPQISRRRRPPHPGHCLGPAGDGARPVSAYQHQRLGGSDLLCRRWPGLDCACDAADQLDGKTRR